MPKSRSKGPILLHVVLEKSPGKTLLGYGRQELAVGLRHIRAAINAADILALGEDGSYLIRRLLLSYLGPDGAVPVDRLEDGTQETFAYLREQFERPPVQLTGQTTDVGIDMDADGDFDILHVEVGIDIVQGGTYGYSVSLVDQCHDQIEFVSGEHTTPGDLVLDFDGTLVGENGVDGPYYVRNLLIYGAGGSLVETRVAETQGYSAGDFDGFTGMPDCNNNGTPDMCDVVSGTSEDCNGNSLPDQCDITVEDGGLCDGEYCSTDCQSEGNPGHRVPDECDITVGPFMFSAAVDYGDLAYPNYVAVDDLNGDGNLDWAVTHGEWYGTVSLRFGDGDGAFDSYFSRQVGPYPWNVAIGDLDGVNGPDLVVVDSLQSEPPFENVFVMLNDAAGFVSGGHRYSVDHVARSVAIGNLNEDTSLDLVTTNPDVDKISVLFNDGNGAFPVYTAYDVGDSPRFVAIGDLDGDGDNDLAVTNRDGNNISLLFNDGYGTFTGESPHAVGTAPESMDIADLDLDGDLDLVIANKGSDTLSVLLNSGNGLSYSDAVYSTGNEPYSVVISDLNGDVYPDLAVANNGSTTVAVLANKGDGTFWSLVPFTVGSGAQSIATGSFDDGNTVDMVLAVLNNPDTYNDDVVSVLLNLTAYATSLDLNRNEVPDECDDCNENGIPDNQDIDEGTSADCNANHTPDECETDCNNNGAPDDCDIVEGTSEDCNENGVPDECDIAVEDGGLCEGEYCSSDCQSEDNPGHGVPDECDIVVGTFAFTEPADYATGTNPLSVAVDDLNGDDNADWVVANNVSDTISVRFGNGDGAFSGGSDLSVLDIPRSVAIGDLDGVNGADLVVIDGLRSEPSEVLVLLNQGGGTFGTGNRYSVEYQQNDLARSVAIGDLNADTALDLVVTSPDVDRIFVLFNDGYGAFLPYTAYDVGDSPHFVGIGDLDGDGDNDLAVTNRDENNISVLFNDGDGTFTGESCHAVETEPMGIDMADLDLDGDLDLAVANMGSGTVSVLLNSGDGLSYSHAVYLTESPLYMDTEPYCVVISDLNGDIYPDLAVANKASTTVGVLANNGNGTFSNPVPFAAGSEPRSIATGSFDDGNTVDMVVANFGNDAVSVLLNLTAHPTSLDWNHNGVPDACDGLPTIPPNEPGFIKCRYISFSPASAGFSTAFRVMVTYLPDFYQGYDYPLAVDDIRWVGQPATYCENAGKVDPPCPAAQPSVDFQGAPLQCDDPHYMDWHGMCEGVPGTCVGGLRQGEPCAVDAECQGIVHVFGEATVPGAEYQVQAIPKGCPVDNEICYSSPLVITTSVWGDVVRNCSISPCGPPDGYVGIPTDVTAVLDKFKNLGPPNFDPAIIKSRADLDWTTPNRRIDISDVTFALDAFRNVGYPPPAFILSDPPSGCDDP